MSTIEMSILDLLELILKNQKGRVQKQYRIKVDGHHTTDKIIVRRGKASFTATVFCHTTGRDIFNERCESTTYDLERNPKNE